MTLKTLSAKGFAIVAGAAAGLAVAAAPASAGISNLTVACAPYGFSGGNCYYAQIQASLTDPTPVSLTINGTALAGSPVTPSQASTGAYYLNLLLDCISSPFHLIATQPAPNGGPASQMEADFVPTSNTNSSGSALFNILPSGSSSLHAPCHIVHQG
ncbi:hypothetical protein [Nocardia sp. NPDC004722]